VATDLFEAANAPAGPDAHDRPGVADTESLPMRDWGDVPLTVEMEAAGYNDSHEDSSGRHPRVAGGPTQPTSPKVEPVGS
jgi:hypothetical protein